MQNTITYVGVDISKPYFDVALPNGEKYQHYKFDNNQTGFSALLKLLPKDCVVVMEASGPYYLNLACFLSEKGLGVSVVNPLIIRRFAQMRMVRAKTDKKDACIIAAYGKTENPPRWVAPQAHIITMQQMEALRSRLQKELTALTNQLESFNSSGKLSKKLSQIIEKEITHKQALMEELTQQMEEEGKKHYGEQLASLESIPGLGRKTAIMLLVVSGGGSRFSDYRKLSAYIGLSPRIYESGISVNPG